MAAPHHIVLVGMMGSGKTTVGARLARRLGRPLVDSDEQVEARTGRTVREIFETDGEPAYRALEAEALAAALAGEEPAVVAAAGGTVLDPVNRQRMREAGVVVWLRGDPDLLAARAASGEHRPLLRDDPVGVMRRLDEERRALYEEVADHVVDIDGEEVEQVVEMVLAAVPEVSA